MPPEFPAANDKTRTPNRSSCRLAPANAPLSAKTNVPVRSSTIGSLSMTPFPAQGSREGFLYRQPGTGRNDKRFNTGLQCRMENGREFRAVVHWKLVDTICFLRLGVGLRIRSVNEPEDRWHVPFRSE